MLQANKLLLVILLLSSCSLERRCRKCKGETKIEVRDSIVTKEVIKTLPGDTVTLYIDVKCPDGQTPIIRIPKNKTKGKTELGAKLINPNLIEILSAADSVSIAVKYNEIHKIKTTTIKIPCKEKNNSWLAYLAIIAFVVGFYLGRKK
jgi:hypothetical protein